MMMARDNLSPASGGAAAGATEATQAPQKPFVDFNRVWLAYDDELARRGEFAVEDISLQAAPGEFIAIVGPSGCGKSTFMKLATGLRPATRGVVSIAGQKVSGPLKQVGMAFQAPTLLHPAGQLPRELVLVARPGRILLRKEIDLPRPRALDVTYSEPFAERVHELREKIGHVRQQ